MTRSDGDLIDPIVIVAELRRRPVAFVLVVDHKSVCVARDTHLPVLDGAQAVGNHRKTGDAECHGAQDVAIVKRHLQPLIEILVVHVVDAVHRMDVGLGEPLHRGVELRHDVVIVEEVAGNRHASAGAT